ncbi:ABC transporter G family member 23-like [Panonychus citri]|uniref:ABC transporter G family member 23-like n=1 Tax=Panonychus citri TaxID=50023 RepID=UPI002307B3CC|nr:ABC transporter G family member 23-like [Panonychus citri]
MLTTLDMNGINNNNNNVLLNSGQFAVYGENISVNLGSLSRPNFVLNKLFISIPKGCIYGLIGPSGCGKTTLQRTIIGLRKPDYGSLKVFNQIPNSKGSNIPGPLIGYMPQEIALDDELTVSEQLTFLGRLAGLSNETIKSKCSEILSIMSIADPSKKSTQFSTGQRRRISLACSLIHSPELLLLDEPTVGSDIVLVHKIWTYLRQLNETVGTTIVITTHYLEEVTRTDYFGFMANGEIKFQGKPKDFMRSVDAVTFEEAILIKYNSRKKDTKTIFDDDPIDEIKLKQIEQQSTTTQSTTTESSSSSSSSSTSISISSVFKPKISSYYLIVLLLWRYLLRWKTTLLYPYLLVCISSVFVGYFLTNFFGRPMVDLTVAYVNLANSSVYISKLNEYLVSRDINLVNVADEIIGRKMVENGQAAAYFIVPQEFDLGLETRVASSLSSNADEALQLAGRITMYQDKSHIIISETIVKELYEALTDIMNSIVSSKGLIGNRLEYFSIQGVIERTDDPELFVSMPLFLIGILTYFCEAYSMMMFTYWVTKESHEPMNERLSSLGITNYHLKGTATLLATFALSLAYFGLFVVFIPLFDIPNKGHLVLIIPIIVGCVLCGIFKAILLGSLIESDVTCFILNLFYSGITWAYGCIAWPYESVYYFIQPLTYLFPNHVSNEAVIRIIVYGDMIHPKVIKGYLFISAMVLIHLILVLLTNRNKSNL